MRKRKKERLKACMTEKMYFVLARKVLILFEFSQVRGSRPVTSYGVQSYDRYAKQLKIMRLIYFILTANVMQLEGLRCAAG